MIRIIPKDKTNHIMGVKPPSVISRAPVIIPTSSSAIAGYSRIL
jgi:hypothetical protein